MEEKKKKRERGRERRKEEKERKKWRKPNGGTGQKTAGEERQTTRDHAGRIIQRF